MDDQDEKTIPNGWKITTLQEIATINPSESLPKGKNAKSVAMECLDPFTRRIGKFEIKEYSGGMKFRNGDTLLARITPCLENGKTSYVDILEDGEVGFGSTEYIVIREKDKISDKKFLYYLVISPRFRETAIKAMTGTSGRQRVETDLLVNSKFVLPLFLEQQAIASALSPLDDKIELLREQNKTLDKIAQSIFKEWFVSFNFLGSTGKLIDSELGEIPEKWRVGKLVELGGEITDYVANGSFASLKENVTLYDTPNYALFLRNTDLKSNFAQKVYVDEHSYNFLKKTQLHGGEIIISNVGDVGSVYLCPFLSIPMVLGNNTISLRSKYQSYFFSLFTNRVGQFLINSITGGSAQPKFNKTDFRNMKMMIPEKDILDLFESTVWLLYSKILKNSIQAQTLSELRDTLLPKLMKGVIRVKGFNN